MNILKDKVNFIMLVGLPGSGKTTVSKRLVEEYGAVHISSDQIRFEKGLAGDQHAGVFEEMLSQTRQNLKAGKSVIYDATNLHRKYRMALLDNIKKLGVYKVCILFTEPYKVCCDRNKQRSEYAIVPEYRMQQMVQSFDVPMEYEGWDAIEIVQTEFGESLIQLFEKTKGFDQDNKHHAFDLYEHLIQTYQYVRDNINAIVLDQDVLLEAAKYHDIGKLFTKTYKKPTGEISDQAHYYRHENVGAYVYLSGEKETKFTDIQCRQVAALINWHMRPYLTMKESKRLEEKKLLGDQFCKMLEILHDADQKAH